MDFLGIQSAKRIFVSIDWIFMHEIEWRIWKDWVPGESTVMNIWKQLKPTWSKRPIPLRLRFGLNLTDESWRFVSNNSHASKEISSYFLHVRLHELDLVIESHVSLGIFVLGFDTAYKTTPASGFALFELHIFDRPYVVFFIQFSTYNSPFWSRQGLVSRGFRISMGNRCKLQCGSHFSWLLFPSCFRMHEWF